MKEKEKLYLQSTQLYQQMTILTNWDWNWLRGDFNSWLKLRFDDCPDEHWSRGKDVREWHYSNHHHETKLIELLCCPPVETWRNDIGRNPVTFLFLNFPMKISEYCPWTKVIVEALAKPGEGLNARLKNQHPQFDNTWDSSASNIWSDADRSRPKTTGALTNPQQKDRYVTVQNWVYRLPYPLTSAISR